MAKLRHLAILVPDPEASARFFMQAFDLERVGEARCGVYLSDGTVNIALLKIETEEEKTGLCHFGMWVDDLDEAQKKALGAGATWVAGHPNSDAAFYECKYRDPDGMVFDLTHQGWVGAVKDVVPAKGVP
jgi:methylmalonyl-CoA/ethylmalonyl-CoA epimerase